MSQLKALNALEPYLSLTSSATSTLAAIDLIARATSNPSTYLFAELLASKNIQALRNTSQASHLRLLEIFTYGSVEDYVATEGLPELNDAQRVKLLQLSFLGLARQGGRLGYKDVMGKLRMEREEELEALVTSVIGAALVNGTLDPRAKTIHIDSVAPLRDLAPGSLATLASIFTAWSASCAEVLAQLKGEDDRIRGEAKKKWEQERRVQALYEKKAQQEDGKGKKMETGGEAMEVDMESRSKGTKRTLTGLLKGAGGSGA